MLTMAAMLLLMNFNPHQILNHPHGNPRRTFRKLPTALLLGGQLKCHNKAKKIQAKLNDLNFFLILH
jgi:hypothetical protein